jgi:hypothetical protein
MANMIGALSDGHFYYFKISGCEFFISHRQIAQAPGNQSGGEDSPVARTAGCQNALSNIRKFYSAFRITIWEKV